MNETLKLKKLDFLLYVPLKLSSPLELPSSISRPSKTLFRRFVLPLRLRLGVQSDLLRGIVNCWSAAQAILSNCPTQLKNFDFEPFC